MVAQVAHVGVEACGEVGGGGYVVGLSVSLGFEEDGGGVFESYESGGDGEVGDRVWGQGWLVGVGVVQWKGGWG